MPTFLLFCSIIVLRSKWNLNISVFTVLLRIRLEILHRGNGPKQLIRLFSQPSWLLYESDRLLWRTPVIYQLIFIISERLIICYRNRRSTLGFTENQTYCSAGLMVTLHRNTGQMLGECNESSKVSSALSRMWVDTFPAVLVFMLWWQ